MDYSDQSIESPNQNVQSNNTVSLSAYREAVGAVRRSVAILEGELKKVKELLIALDDQPADFAADNKLNNQFGLSEALEGVFDGEKMLTADGTVYNVPANYASKSKLVEGDILKLIIGVNGNLIFKQLRPIERRRVIAEVQEDEQGNYWAVTADRRWRILTASVTYFKGGAGDEVAILVPKEAGSRWAAVEYVRPKSGLQQVSGLDND